MKIRLVYLFLLFFISGICFSQESSVEEELVTRSYQVRQHALLAANAQGYGGDPFGGGHSKQQRENQMPWARKQDSPEARKYYFAERFGLSFPDGSTITFEKSLGLLTMNNTVKNHDRLYRGLLVSSSIASQFQIQIRILSFDKDMIDQLDRRHPSGIPDQIILKLWSEGKGETITSQSIKTINGVNAIIECVEERIYPTSSGVVEVEEGVISTTSFGELETRDIGVILNVTPTMSPQGLVNLVVLPEQAESFGSSNDENKELSPLTPLFRSVNLTSSIVVSLSESVVLGSSVSFDGDKHLFIMGSVQLIDSSGNVLTLPKLIH